MTIWDIIDSAAVPGGDGFLSLHKRDNEFVIFVDDRRLMDSRVASSEETLAELACEHLAGRPDPVMLIGGLGMGLTLRAALAGLPKTARVEVAELVPAVVRWNRDHFPHLSNHALDDSRVVIREEDVGGIITAAHHRYDAILLDVDNGPTGLTRSINDRIYTMDGLSAARNALRPGGVLNIWSSWNDEEFTRQLEHAGFDVKVETVRSAATDPSEHTIWVATASESRS